MHQPVPPAVLRVQGLGVRIKAYPLLRQPDKQAADKFQRVEAGLIRQPQTARHGEGQLCLLFHDDRKPQAQAGVPLLLQLAPVIAVGGIQHGGTAMEFAVGAETAGQSGVFLHRILMDMRVQPSFLPAQSPQQLVVNQFVLGGNFSGGMRGGAGAQLVRVHHTNVGHALFHQPAGGQQAAHAAADNQHAGFPLQPLWKCLRRQRRHFILLPYRRIIHGHPFFPFGLPRYGQLPILL